LKAWKRFWNFFNRFFWFSDFSVFYAPLPNHENLITFIDHGKELLLRNLISRKMPFYFSPTIWALNTTLVKINGNPFVVKFIPFIYDFFPIFFDYFIVFPFGMQFSADHVRIKWKLWEWRREISNNCDYGGKIRFLCKEITFSRFAFLVYLLWFMEFLLMFFPFFCCFRWVLLWMARNFLMICNSRKFF
jgi:hypothetical protein